VGKPDYTPPELYGTRYGEFDRRPEHDDFALAVLIFQLLMQGFHPFAGRFTGQGDPDPIPKRIAAGHWPYAKSRPVPYEPNPHAPPLEVLPAPLPELVRRCFEEGHTTPAARPTAAQWHEALREAEQRLQPCIVNRQHLFNQALLICPWCDLAARQGRDPFPSAADVQSGNIGIPLALPVSAETPAGDALPVIPVDEFPPLDISIGPVRDSYQDGEREPSLILQLILSPLWLCVIALVGLAILFAAILHSRTSREKGPPQTPGRLAPANRPRFGERRFTSRRTVPGSGQVATSRGTSAGGSAPGRAR
jgi:DNA-binding helix-hairpin-helix protein with protein kinase domain